jgi:ABC-type transport system involved in cytochrome c biogenesis permease subunit
VLYALALLLRRLRRWQGRQTALASLAGLAAILFSLMAVNFFFTDFHEFL